MSLLWYWLHDYVFVKIYRSIHQKEQILQYVHENKLRLLPFRQMTEMKLGEVKSVF